MVALPLTDNALFISASFREIYAACPRAGEYYKLNGRVSADPASAMVFGSHLHSALQMHYRLKEYGLSADEVRSRVASMLERQFATKPTVEGDFRNLNWAQQIYEQYVPRFEFETLQLMKYTEPQDCRECLGTGGGSEPCPWCNATGKSSIMCEVPFALDLLSNWAERWPHRVIYHGFIDLPCYLDKQVVVADWKTTSMLGQSFWDDKRMSAQQVGYAWAFTKLTGQQVRGFMVRGIRTSQMPAYVLAGKPSKTGECRTAERWWSDAFVEERFYLGQDELDEWHFNTCELMDQFFWHHKKGYFPQHKPTGCVHKYGRCQFFEVCNTFPAKDRLHVLNSGLFKDKEASFEQERL